MKLSSLALIALFSTALSYAQDDIISADIEAESSASSSSQDMPKDLETKHEEEHKNPSEEISDKSLEDAVKAMEHLEGTATPEEHPTTEAHEGDHAVPSSEHETSAKHDEIPLEPEAQHDPMAETHHEPSHESAKHDEKCPDMSKIKDDIIKSVMDAFDKQPM